MSNDPTPVQMWAAVDGKLHKTKELAQAHNDFLRITREFNFRNNTTFTNPNFYEALTAIFLRYPLPPKE